MKVLFFLLISLLVISTNAELPNVLVPSRYSNSKAMDSKLTIYWEITNDTIEFCLVGTGVSGWVGVGFAKLTGMLHSDVCIGWVDDTGPMVIDYNIGDTRQPTFTCSPSVDAVCLDTDKSGQNNILEYNGTLTGGTTTVVFTRKLDTGDPIDVVLTNKVQTTIYGWNSALKGPSLQQHTVIPTPVGVNFFTGKAVKKIDLKLVHGSLMFIAWFLIAPVGFIFARFLKAFPWWFNAHRISMGVAMATQICGFGVIVHEVQSVSGPHFSSAHEVIGLIVFILGVSQPVIGFLADKLFNPERKSIPIFPDKTHWFLGWISITLGMINIILGLILYPNTKRGTLIAYCFFAALVFSGIVGFAIFRIIKPAKATH